MDVRRPLTCALKVPAQAVLVVPVVDLKVAS